MLEQAITVLLLNFHHFQVGRIKKKKISGACIHLHTKLSKADSRIDPRKSMLQLCLSFTLTSGQISISNMRDISLVNMVAYLVNGDQFHFGYEIGEGKQITSGGRTCRSSQVETKKKLKSKKKKIKPHPLLHIFHLSHSSEMAAPETISPYMSPKNLSKTRKGGANITNR